MIWLRPLQRPFWINEDEYKQQLETLSARMIDVQIYQPGYRAKRFTITTTITDRKA